MEITAPMVKALRDKTGLSMMDCKKALVEADGNQERAIEILRKAGLGRIGRLALRAATKGRVACYVDPQRQRGGIVELRCETAPVADTDDFVKLADLLARHAAELDQPTPESVLDSTCLDHAGRRVADVMHAALDRVRENIKIARVGSLRGHLGQYLHHNAQIGVLLEMSADCPPELKADVCMHIAAMNPPFTRREDIGPELIEKERQFAAEEVKNKPPQIIDKIVQGKLNRWYSEIVLLEQPFVKDDKKSVGQVLMAAVPGLTVSRFLRFEVGVT